MPLVARAAAGALFMAFSVGTFTRHGAEAAAFERYGIPAPGLMTYAVGPLELLGGLALVLGIGTRVAALRPAAAMAGAVATAGRIEGGPVHLGLAPALPAVMLALLWTGAGARSLDRALARRGRARAGGRRPPPPGAGDLRGWRWPGRPRRWTRGAPRPSPWCAGCPGRSARGRRRSRSGRG